MTSRRQLEANRVNAKRSTGPRTPSGKARSRMNAVNHGLTAKNVVVAGEKPEDFDAFRDELMADFRPVNTIGRELVDRTAGLLWRLRRCPAVEAELLNSLINQSGCFDWSRLTNEELEQAEQLFTKALQKPLEPTISSIVEHQARSEKKEVGVSQRVEMLSIFSRYEAGLMNALIKTLTLLHGLVPQDRRRRVSAGLPQSHAKPGRESNRVIGL